MTPIERLADQLRRAVARQAHGYAGVVPWRNLSRDKRQVWMDIAKAITTPILQAPMSLLPFSVLATDRRVGLSEKMEDIARDLYEGYHVRSDKSGKMSLYHLPKYTHHSCIVALPPACLLSDIMTTWTRHLKECKWEDMDPNKATDRDANEECGRGDGEDSSRES